MATVAEFSVSSDAFPLGPIFRTLPEVSVELERVVPTDDAVLPYFWVRGAGADLVIEALTDHPEIESVTLVDEIDAQSLFRARWREDVDSIVTAIIAADVTLLSASGSHGQWRFEIRAERAEEIAAFQKYCRDHDIALTLNSVHALAERNAGEEYGLTPEQREALLLAYEAGYYAEPRAVTLAELAADLDITRQSLSSRLRRGYRNLLASTIARTADQ